MGGGGWMDSVHTHRREREQGRVQHPSLTAHRSPHIFSIPLIQQYHCEFAIFKQCLHIPYICITLKSNMH